MEQCSELPLGVVLFRKSGFVDPLDKIETDAVPFLVHAVA